MRLIALVLAILAPTLALAHGPTRQKVSVSVEIKAPPAEVWEVIGNFQDMGWHPAVQATTGEGGNDIDATRRLDLGGGATIDEVLYKFDAGKMTYSYRITEVAVEVLPVTNYSSTITVMPDGDGTMVEWRGAFYRGYPNNDPPENLSDEAAVAAVTGVYESGLRALQSRFLGN